MIQFLSLFVAVLVQFNIFGGFVKGTRVASISSLYSIEKLTCGISVDSWSDNKCECNKVIAVWLTGKQLCRAIILPDNETIVVSPTQLFYVSSGSCWKAAHELQVSDYLLTREGGSIAIIDIQQLTEPLQCYDITVEKNHTFFVSSHNVLVHNFFPVGFGVTFLVGWGSIEFAGASIALGCAALGSWIGARLWKTRIPDNSESPFEDKYQTHYLGNSSVINDSNFEMYVTSASSHSPYIAPYDQKNEGQPSFSADDRLKDAGAPGIPTDQEGYHPPKGWDGKKKRHPDTGQIGWPDNKGGVWVPTGPEGYPLAHGGPHWDVIDKNGNHRNVRPKQKAS